MLLNQAVLDQAAQTILLSEVVPVFTEEDNKKLEKPPTKEDVKDVLFNSNLRAAPGTDGITSLMYKECWDTLGDALHQVFLAIREGKPLTVRQKTSLMVSGQSQRS